VEITQRNYSFDAVSSPDARVLILGSLPGRKSLGMKQYYAHERNLFWDIMGEIAGAHREVEDRYAKLIARGIALWDVYASAERPNSSLDKDIKKGKVNDFASFYTVHPSIKLICFNGTEAEKTYRRVALSTLPVSFQHIPRVLLPSTSPTPSRKPLSPKQKTALWKAAILPVLS
jgi:hypoxanthine-DNA glycosylase